jgi:hypothetical protein
MALLWRSYHERQNIAFLFDGLFWGVCSNEQCQTSLPVL